jgi:protein-S-isoprenylcysteine O-methyltransferase Ste14
MILKNRNASVVLLFANLCLICFFMWPRLFPFTRNLSPDLVDGVGGLLLGVAIGLEIWAFKLIYRQRRSE